ncbi:MAG: FecR domain-containing protein [Prolixibacteraceae bacterium]|jgi:ferric-dicitrate binding protein FerR (iron transport regulator)|nr:FecR domain-containing protein [Prolixibacteraceae bacterium]
MKNDQLFKPEDFVLDDAFRKSVLSPDISSENYWKKFREDHPWKKQAMEEARQIILSLEPLEEEIPEYRLNKLWQRINQSRRGRLVPIPRQWANYAAIFILAFLLGAAGLFLIKPGNNYSETYTEIKVPYGEKSEVTLYDGTKVWLNSGTKLRFPIVFNSEKRNVFVEGEAFFDVAKNMKQAFIVHAGEMKVEVLGTRFNVCAYPEDKEFSATLEEGKIVACTSSAKKKIELDPGEQAIFSLSSQKINVRQVNTGLYTSWKENLLRLEDAGFPELVKKMERWYDVKIHVEEIGSFTKQYNMTIKTESLREMLQLISLATPIQYEINENRVLITRR